MNIAMFTNNYKPFIGGVPISIERLSEGLRSLGHRVTVGSEMCIRDRSWETVLIEKSKHFSGREILM